MHIGTKDCLPILVFQNHTRTRSSPSLSLTHHSLLITYLPSYSSYPPTCSVIHQQFPHWRQFQNLAISRDEELELLTAGVWRPMVKVADWQCVCDVTAWDEVERPSARCAAPLGHCHWPCWVNRSSSAILISLFLINYVPFFHKLISSLMDFYFQKILSLCFILRFSI